MALLQPCSSELGEDVLISRVISRGCGLVVCPRRSWLRGSVGDSSRNVDLPWGRLQLALLGSAGLWLTTLTVRLLIIAVVTAVPGHESALEESAGDVPFFFRALECPMS